MKTILKYLHIYLVKFKYEFKIFTNSISNFIIGILAFLIIQISGLLFIGILYNNTSSIDEFNVYQMLALYGFAQLTKGIDHFYSDFLWNFSSNGVTRGLYDKYLVRPLNPLFQIIIEKVQFDALGEIITGISLYVYAILKLKIDINFILILKTLFFLLIGVIVYTCLKVIATSSVFYIKKGFGILNALYSISTYAKYPITIYPKVMQMILTYIFAYSLTAYYPIKYILLEKLNIYIFMKLIIIVIVLIIVTKIIWKQGEKRYESSGS
ncbi:ABC transporter permease [Streptobacillus moniliformis]|uniref:ABC transporter permease n=1 Tax=Streptobacillus moniliformis TaxID=34105 RepID=UPI0007E41299|nr:ABC-2 family transporter protein [Streptobacillus moniliformis]